MPENENQKKKWITVKVSHNAMIKEMPKHLFMKMPPNGNTAIIPITFLRAR